MVCASKRRRRLYLYRMPNRLGEGQPAYGWILYDGACGVCSHWVLKYGAILARLGLAVAPLQSSWVEQRTGLPRELLLTDIRLLHRDGSLTSGADVYRYVMRRIWWAFPLYLLSIAPGLRDAFDWGYRTFAHHRMRISASCGIPQ
jgi:predicted DCC family thiol-disulfide oxidoreductase YuxK